MKGVLSKNLKIRINQAGASTTWSTPEKNFEQFLRVLQNNKNHVSEKDMEIMLDRKANGKDQK